MLLQKIKSIMKMNNFLPHGINVEYIVMLLLKKSNIYIKYLENPPIIDGELIDIKQKFEQPRLQIQ